MDNLDNNNSKVILRNDPAFPDYIDWEFLRKEGIEHLGNLSGKIWTDHNVHDPGITILEMLCYAILDLGYRTQLPIEDLLASDQSMPINEDNFFTPAEALTCNPVTILDYRKLLIDTSGVRNAWLEINEEQLIYLNQIFQNDNIEEATLTCDPLNDRSKKLVLNGLYDIYLELERPDLNCPVVHDPDQIRIIIDSVKEKLQSHRNLCEDFVNINILCEEEISFCGRIDLDPDADAEKVNLEIYKAISEFLSPTITFYTLEQMLDSGIPIEEIFSGRPYITESFGFIKSEELSKSDRKMTIHVSDIYALIGNIKGVNNVTNLLVKSNLTTKNPADCDYWVLDLNKNHVPVFCIDNTCFEFYKDRSSLVKINKESIRASFNEIIKNNRTLFTEVLDKAIPKGNHLKDLGDYYSIQNEFPRNYGIGEGGLSKDATVLRKSQALQLKGYLLFFDQLLSNYLAQLDHIRDIFSLYPDSKRPVESHHTYFGGELDTIPQIEKLIRFYTDNYSQSDGWIKNSVLGLPISQHSLQSATVEEAQLLPITFSSYSERDIVICQFQREFKQNEYEIEILPDECGYIFSLKTSIDEVLINSKSTYATKEEAQLAAKTLTFLGTLEHAYNRVNNYENDEFSFELTYQPIAYLKYLQALMEDKEKYLDRRGDFLDHLMDRFSENFNDYVLLNYGSNTEALSSLAQKQKENECKARLLSKNPQINRNRLKAYNYQINGWNNKNISGYENRIAALSCLPLDNRQSMCNFEIVEYNDEFVFELRDDSGTAIFKSVEKYKSTAESQKSFKSFITGIKHYENYLPENKIEEGVYGIIVKHPMGLATYAKSFSNLADRNFELDRLTALIASESLDQNIKITKYESRLILSDHQKTNFKESRKKYETKALAEKAFSDFAEKINNQLWMVGAEKRIKLDLIPTSDPTVFLNRSTAIENSCQIKSQFRWMILGQDKNLWIKSTEVYQSAAEANGGLARILAYDNNNLDLSKYEENNNFFLRLSDKNGTLIAEGQFPSEKLRESGYSYMSWFISSNAVGHPWIKQHNEVYGWEIWDSDDVLFSSDLLYDDKRKVQVAADKANKLCQQHKNFAINESDNNGFRLDLTEGFQIVASSPIICSTKQEADALRQRIVEIWTKEGYITREGETGFQYTIPLHENDTEKVLNSYNLYRSRLKTVNALDELFKIIRRKTAYLSTGDEANLNFSFMIRLKGNFIASHPERYNTAAERDKAIAIVQKQLKAIHHPFAVVEEFIHQIELDNEILLVSTDSYSNQNEANRGFIDMLPFIVDARNFEKQSSSDGLNGLILKNNLEQHIASYPFDYINWDTGDEIIDKISAFYKPHTFHISADEYESEWNYIYKFPTPDANENIAVHSINNFHSKDEARESYSTFLKNFPKLKISPIIISEEAFKIRIVLGEDQILAESESTYTKSEVEEIVVHANEAKENVVLHQNIVKTVESSPQSSVFKVPGLRGGNFAYRVLKKDECIAYHPCSCAEKKEEGLLELLFGQAHIGYQYLEICLGGNICEKIDGSYHYLIRDRINDLVYFKSYRGYESEEEARVAFANQYLLLIDRASNVSNYGSYDPENIPDILIEEQYDVHLEPCKNDKEPIAVINKEIKDHFSLQQLADIACSYPIRIKITRTELDCKVEEEICYYFHLIDFTRDIRSDCKEDWISKICYETVEQTRSDFKKFLNLLVYKGNYAHDLVMDKCCYQIVIKEVLLESEEGYPTESDGWGALEKIFKNACDPNSYYVHWNEEKCKFKIHAVLPGFYVGCYPKIFNLREEAVTKATEISNTIQLDPAEFLQINVFNEYISDKSSFGFTISQANQEGQVWKNFTMYQNEEEALEAAWLVNSLAREESFYGLHDNEHVIYRKNKEFAIPLPEDIVAIQQGENKLSVYDLVRQARLFPVVKESEGFVIQIYDTSEGAEKSEPEILMKREEHYENLEDLYEGLKLTQVLVSQKSNWEIIETGDCQGFKICLADPSKVFAFHPQEYTHQYMVDDAIANIIECMNIDGLHVVEHILLRPQTRQDCLCLLSPCPNFDCEVELPLSDPDPCAEIRNSSDNQNDNNAETIVPGGDTYSFWATVVLPGWTKKFRSLAYRETFQNLLRKEAPAHIALNIVWLSPKLMCKFERKYRSWLRWKSCKPPCFGEDPLCDLVDCISSLTSTPPDIPEPDDESCDCDTPRSVNRTNLLINYCFNKQRNEVYGQDFFTAMGLSGGFSFSHLSHLVSLPVKNLVPLFPGVNLFQVLEPIRTDAVESNIPGAISDIDHLASEKEIKVKKADKGKQNKDTSSKPTVAKIKKESVKRSLSAEEIEKNIRRRLATYLDDIKKIGDEKFRQGEPYERSKLFLTSSGENKVFEDLLNLVWNTRKRARSQKMKTAYLELVKVITAFYLDQKVISNALEIEQSTRITIDKIRQLTQSEDENLMTNWNGEQWKSWQDVKIIDELKGFFES